jgi:head-tail adaptor
MGRAAAGARNRLIRFWPVTVSLDALGTETEAQGQAEAAWASVRFGSGAERREAGQAGSVLSATFRVPSTAALRGATERWQIEFDGARWGITSIVPIGEAGDIEFTATKKGA